MTSGPELHLGLGELLGNSAVMIIGRISGRRAAAWTLGTNEPGKDDIRRGVTVIPPTMIRTQLRRSALLGRPELRLERSSVRGRAFIPVLLGRPSANPSLLALPI